MQYTLGIDLGGTKIALGAIDTSAKVICSRQVPTDVKGGPQKVIEQIVHNAQELIDEQGHAPKAIGIGLPGQVDAKNGKVLFAPNLNWNNVSIQDELQKALNVPVRVGNDVQVATIGEWQEGAGKGYSDIVSLFVGTGIGGGIISQGKLLQGATHSAGEVGHMIIEMNGRACACGGKGCLEAYASGWAIAKRAQKKSAKEVAEAFKEGDKAARAIIEEVKEALITGGVTIANILNPQIIILGGGVINGLPELVAPIRKGILDHALKSASNELKVVSAKLGGNGGIIGAAIYATSY